MAESKANFNRQDEEEKRGDKQLPEESGGTTTCHNVSKNPSTIASRQGIYSSKTLHGDACEIRTHAALLFLPLNNRLATSPRSLMKKLE